MKVQQVLKYTPKRNIITHQANYSSLYAVCLQPTVSHIVHRHILERSDRCSTCGTNYHTAPSRWACNVCCL